MFRSGKRNFEKCPHKSIDFETVNVDRGPFIVGSKLTCPGIEDGHARVSSVEARAEGFRVHKEYRHPYVIHWGNKKEGWDSYTGQQRAYQHLAEVAGEVACDGCPYARLDPVQLSKARADLAEQAVTIALHDQRRLEAQQRLGEIMSEIAELESSPPPEQ